MPDRSPPPGFMPPQIDLRQFYRLFFEETQDNLDQLERMLLSTDWAQASDEDFHALFRCAHSIKGSAATFGFDAIAELSHHMESLLDLWRKRLRSPDAASINHMLTAADVVRSLVQAHTEERPMEPPLLAQWERAVAQLQALPAQSEVPQAPVAKASPSIPPETLSAPLVASAPLPSDDDDFGFFADAPGAPVTLSTPAISAAPAPVHAEDNSPTTAPPVSTPQAEPVSTGVLPQAADATLHSVRVPVERVDNLVNLLGELVVSQTTLQQTVQTLEKSQRDALQLQLDVQQELIRTMRDTVMHIRMVPVAQLFKRFPRLVHDLSQRLGKHVRLVTEGDSTELDKGIIERITDPLMHLLRNCMDHGIESPEERQQLGKPAEGTLAVRAHTNGSHVILQVQDDGRGLSRAKLLASAAQRGIQLPEDTPDARIWQLAFLPGLSTAATVSDVSGRGVGMDVVQRNIEALGGKVTLESTPQQGTTITLWLPLTLAITDGLLVQTGSEHYIVPLAAVQESMPAKPLRIDTVGHRANLVHLNDTYYPVVALDQLLGIPRAAAHPDADNATLLLLHAGPHRVGLLVDALLGQQQVVVKSVETHYRKIPYISAATILGNGQVALILDVTQLAAIRQSHSLQPEAQPLSALPSLSATGV